MDSKDPENDKYKTIKELKKLYEVSLSYRKAEEERIRREMEIRQYEMSKGIKMHGSGELQHLAARSD
jgi:hypothetical protein